jgi:hypothetical protein
MVLLTNVAVAPLDLKDNSFRSYLRSPFLPDGAFVLPLKNVELVTVDIHAQSTDH